VIFMTWFLNRSLTVKLMAGFATFGILIGVVGALGVRAVDATNESSQLIYQTQYRPSMDVAEMQVREQRLRADLFRCFYSADPAKIAESAAEFPKLRKELESLAEQLATHLTSPEEKAALAKYREIDAELTRVRQDSVIRPFLAGQRDEAMRGIEKGVALFEQAVATLAKIGDQKRAAADEHYRNSQAAAHATAVQMTVCTVIGMFLALAVGYLLARSITRPLSRTVTLLEAVAAGDFSQHVDVTYTDEVGRMTSSLNKAIGSVRSALTEVHHFAATLAAAASELTTATEEIAAGAQEQASSLEETASSLEEITATVKQNTDSAQQARQLAGNSRDVAEKGGQVVGNAVEAMAAINQSSKKIADIITAIDEIAFQTNLLALNAAVEAARAGEQGRGFAVVAAEVRNLAQRSATAAKEIKTLIQDSVRKVDNGTELVNRSGQTLNDIVISVKRVTDIVAEIAAASREQSTGIDQVNAAVAQMDKVTQTNASQTEELSGTAQSLLGHAARLQELVDRFKLGETAASPALIVPLARTTPKPRRSAPTRSPRRSPAGGVHELDRLDDSFAGAGAGGEAGFQEF
jgi:methyl-accepting chemotaxis protein